MSSYGFDESHIKISWKDSGVSFPETYDELEYIGFQWAQEQGSISSSEVIDRRPFILAKLK